MREIKETIVSVAFIRPLQGSNTGSLDASALELALEELLAAAGASYLAALFLPEDGRRGVSCGAAIEGDASPLDGNLISGLGGDLRWD